MLLHVIHEIAICMLAIAAILWFAIVVTRVVTKAVMSERDKYNLTHPKKDR